MQVPAESVEISSGDPARRERTADSGNVVQTCFCADCGSALFSQNSARPRIRTVYVGTLENAAAVEITAHIWTDSKLPWVVLPEGHRTFPRAGDWTEDYAADIGRYKPDRGDATRLQEEILMSEFRKAKARVQLSPGESVRIMRELQELSQNKLAEITGIPQSTISAIERERINLGVERAKVLARA